MVTRFVVGLLTLVVLLPWTPARADDAPSTAPSFASQELLVRYKDGHSPAAVAALHGRVGARALKKFTHVRNLEHLTYSGNEPVPDVVAKYLADPNVLYAEPNFVAYADQNDPKFGQLYGMQKIAAPSAWGITK